MFANASDPRDSFAKPCAMKPYPTIRRSGIGAHRAIRNRLSCSNGLLRTESPGLLPWREILFIFHLLPVGLENIDSDRRDVSPQQRPVSQRARQPHSRP